MEHTWHTCNCQEGSCVYCGGGLSSCDVCHGAEGSLPTDCPGVAVDHDTRERIYAGAIDYRDGHGWVKPDGTGTSMGDMNIKVERIRASKEETIR